MQIFVVYNYISYFFSVFIVYLLSCNSQICHTKVADEKSGEVFGQQNAIPYIKFTLIIK